MYLVFTICALGTLLSTCSGFGKLFHNVTQQNDENKGYSNSLLSMGKYVCFWMAKFVFFIIVSKIKCPSWSILNILYITVTDLDLFNEKMLKLHNDHRCKHGAGNLTFDNEVSNYIHIYIYIYILFLVWVVIIIGWCVKDI